MADPKAQMRAAILTGAMTFEPAPLDLTEVRVPAIRRIVEHIEPPLDLTVNPFRYLVTRDGEVRPLRRNCGHRRHRR